MPLARDRLPPRDLVRGPTRKLLLLLLNVGLTRTRVPTATPEDDRGEKAEPRRYALLTLIFFPR